MSRMNIKAGDTVMIITGRDRNKKGKVIRVSPKENKLLIEKLNMVSKHVKPRRQGEQGGIISGESAIYACKVMLVCPKCGVATRVGHGTDKNGRRVRVCRQPGCGNMF